MTTTDRTTSTASTASTEPAVRGRRRSVQLLAAGVLALMLALTVASRPSDAFNPNQTSAQGVLTVQAQWYGGVNDFWARTFAGWGWRYTPPGLTWYNSAAGNLPNTPCGMTKANNGSYCSANHRIYLDYSYMQYLINTRGDYAAGGFIAHEWGHAIARLVGFRYTSPGGEYLADCLAGMSARWGYATNRVIGNDYYEFRGWLSSQRTSASHGTGAGRAAWYDFGYSQYNVNQCGRAVSGGLVAGGLTASVASEAASTTGPSTPAPVGRRGPSTDPSLRVPVQQFGIRGP
jgi:hypothetical protein